MTINNKITISIIFTISILILGYFGYTQFYHNFIPKPQILNKRIIKSIDKYYVLVQSNCPIMSYQPGPFIVPLSKDQPNSQELNSILKSIDISPKVLSQNPPLTDTYFANIELNSINNVISFACAFGNKLSPNTLRLKHDISTLSLQELK